MMAIIIDQIKHLLGGNIDKAHLYLTTLDGFYFPPNSVFFECLSPSSLWAFEAVKLMSTQKDLNQLHSSLVHDCNTIETEALFPPSKKKRDIKSDSKLQ